MGWGAREVSTTESRWEFHCYHVIWATT